MNDWTADIYRKAIDKIAPAVESQTGVAFSERPNVVAGGLEVLIPFAERRVSKANDHSEEKKSADELKVQAHKLTNDTLQNLTTTYDPTTNTIIINDERRKGFAGFADLAYMLTTSLQYQEAGDLILPYDLGVIKKADDRTAKDISLSGQRIYVAHQVMSGNRNQGKDYADGYKKTSRAISLPLVEIINSIAFAKDLKGANSTVSNQSNMGYRDLVRTEVDCQRLVGELQGLLQPENIQDLSIAETIKVIRLFDTLRGTGLMKRAGYQFNRDLASVGVPAQTVMTQIPSSLSEVNVGFYQK